MNTRILVRAHAAILCTLRHGASCNAPDGAGRTPRHKVVNAESVHLLTKAGADPNAADPSGNTPLHVAATRVQYDREPAYRIVDAMTARGADASRRNAKGQVPLDLAKPCDSRFAALLAGHWNKSQTGAFGQLEFMIKVAIAAVLIAVAIPAWQHYRLQSRIKDGIALADPARAAVAKIFDEQGPSDMARHDTAKSVIPAPTEDVQSVSISRDGVITIRFSEKVAAMGEDRLQIVPVADGIPLDLSLPANKGRKFQWECGGAAGKTTVLAKYRTTDCR